MTRLVRPPANPAVVVITGASGGIGSALARAYAERGVVLGLGGRNAVRLAAVAEACRSAGAQVEAALVDVTDAAAMRRFLTELDARHRLDLVIANAGVSAGRHPSGEHETLAEAERVFAVNLAGTLNTLAPAIELMRRRSCGQIAVIGSLAGRRGLPSSPAYSGSKAAIETYAQALRGALAAEGIKVSVVSPGYVATPMGERVAGWKPFLVDAERAARIIRRGLAQNRARIAFPMPLSFGVRLLTGLPDWAAGRILRRFAFTVRPELEER